MPSGVLLRSAFSYVMMRKTCMERITKAMINIFRFFGEFTPIVPYAPVFFSKQGLTLSQISFLFLIGALTTVALEIPTGILADKINRKTVLILSRLAKLSCFVVWLISPTLSGFLVGFVLWGLATALDSGAFQAFVYDTLQRSNQSERFSEVYGSSAGWSFVGLFLSAITAALLIPWGFMPLLTVAIISLMISLITVFFIPRPLSVVSGEKKSSIGLMLSSIKFLSASKLLIGILVLGIAAGGIKGSLEEYYSLFLESKGVALVVIGIAIASFEAMKSLGAFVASRVQRMLALQTFLVMIVGALLIASGFVPGYYIILLLAIVAIIDAMFWVANDTAIQRAAHARNRATLASLKNFGIEVIALLSFALFNVTAQQVPLNGLFIVGGSILILLSIVFTSRFLRSVQDVHYKKIAEEII